MSTNVLSIILSNQFIENQAVENSTTPQSGDFGWQTYASSVSYSFDNDTAETKTVNVWFKDAAGNVSGSVADSIILSGWSGTKQLGTSSDDHAYGIITDSSNNVYVTGYTNGGLDGNTSAGSSDLFLVKYDSGGNKQ